jgi:hypothetical protein
VLDRSKKIGRLDNNSRDIIVELLFQLTHIDRHPARSAPDSIRSADSSHTFRQQLDIRDERFAAIRKVFFLLIRMRHQHGFRQSGAPVVK